MLKHIVSTVKLIMHIYFPIKWTVTTFNANSEQVPYRSTGSLAASLYTDYVVQS